MGDNEKSGTWEAHLMVACEGCGMTEQVPGGFQLKPDSPKTAKLYFLRGTPAIKCEKCGWHEPIEADDMPYYLMKLTKTKDFRGLFAWVAGRIAESEGLEK